MGMTRAQRALHKAGLKASRLRAAAERKERRLRHEQENSNDRRGD